MLENPYCFRCDSQNLKSIDIRDFNSDNAIEVEELECQDCWFRTRIPLYNKPQQLRKNIESLSNNTNAQEVDVK